MDEDIDTEDGHQINRYGFVRLQGITPTIIVAELYFHSSEPIVHACPRK